MLARCFVDTKSKNVYHVIRCVDRGQFVKAEPLLASSGKKKIIYRVYKLSSGEPLFSIKKTTFLKYFEPWNLTDIQVTRQ